MLVLAIDIEDMQLVYDVYAIRLSSSQLYAVVAFICLRPGATFSVLHTLFI